MKPSETYHCERCGSELVLGRRWTFVGTMDDMLSPIMPFLWRWRKTELKHYIYDHNGQAVRICRICQLYLEEQREAEEREKAKQQIAKKNSEIKARVDAWDAAHKASSNDAVDRASGPAGRGAGGPSAGDGRGDGGGRSP